MGNIFGRPKKKGNPLVTEQDKAILQLKQQRDKVKQYQKRIKEQLVKEREIARELLKKDKKDKALLLLKKKKYMESVMDKTDNQLMNLERMVSDIEFAQIEVTIVEGLKSGNEALKQLHSVFSIDEVETIMDDTREGIEKQQEIDKLLNGLNFEHNEDELLQELESMIGERDRDRVKTEEEDRKKVESQLSEPEIVLPKVPLHEPTIEKEEEEVEKVSQKKQMIAA